MAHYSCRILRDSEVARRITVAVALLLGLTRSAGGWALDVMITPALGSVETVHQGEKVVVQRNQDRRHTVNPFFTYTSRRCPPFCIQPMVAAPGVETYGELEVLNVLDRLGEGDHSVILVDARTAQWPRRGMIPGAVNIPWSEFDVDSEAELFERIFQPHFSVKMSGGALDFSDAKTIILYCNGIWCSQSTNAIDALLEAGYPAEKLKWYRGGMQDWESLGLTTVSGGQ